MGERTSMSKFIWKCIKVRLHIGNGLLVIHIFMGKSLIWNNKKKKILHTGYVEW